MTIDAGTAATASATHIDRIDATNGVGPNARQQISYYGDIIVRVDSLEELPPTPGAPPYKGLTYFAEADAAIFLGREQPSDDLAVRLQTTRFLAVACAIRIGDVDLLDP